MTKETGGEAGGNKKSTHYFELSAGTKLHEFEIVSVLGHGGFGITYLATDTLLQDRVAIKEFFPNDLAIRASDTTVRAKAGEDQPLFENGLKTFLEEARLLARFRHRNIVHVRRFFSFHGTGYIVQDFVPGETLSKRLRSGGYMTEAELRGLLAGVLDGLEAAHERAILHRDLKPDNIILREDGTPVLIDFGAARDYSGRDSRSITAISSGGYTPPEQWGVSGGQHGPWTDLYALGAVAYRCVTGKTPPVSVQRLRNDRMIPASEAVKGAYSPGLLAVIDWMLKIDEAERPQSAAEVRAALAQPASAPPAPAPKRLAAEEKKPARSATRWLVPALVALALIIAGGGYALYSVQQQRIANEEKLFREAADDLDKMQAYLRDCRTCAHRAEAEQRVPALENLAVEKKRLADEDAAYNAARGDFAKLTAYVEKCAACRHADAARKEITRLRTELSANESAAYAAARGNVERLQAYADTCKVCEFSIAARTEIGRIAQTRTEEQIYRSASGDLGRLKDYLSSCRVCEYRSQADAEIAKLETADLAKWLQGKTILVEEVMVRHFSNSAGRDQFDSLLRFRFVENGLIEFDIPRSSRRVEKDDWSQKHSYIFRINETIDALRNSPRRQPFLTRLAQLTFSRAVLATEIRENRLELQFKETTLYDAPGGNWIYYKEDGTHEWTFSIELSNNRSSCSFRRLHDVERNHNRNKHRLNGRHYESVTVFVRETASAACRIQ